MSLNTTLCHPEAESLTDLTYADGYLASHPNSDRWSGLTGTDEEITATKEGLLRAASRMICRAPLNAAPLCGLYDWDRQGLALPAIGHTVHFVSPVNIDGDAFSSSSLVGVSATRLIGGAVRTSEGETIGIKDFDTTTGTITLEESPQSLDENLSCAVIEALDDRVRQAVCEQAIYLAGRPNFQLLDRGEQGVKKLATTGTGGGTAEHFKVSAFAELCFAARRLLKATGLLQTGRSIESGRA